MGTKQVRLSDPSQIKKRINEFKGKQINIVLSDNTVMVGELMQVLEAEIILKNMRLKNSSYPLSKISEVYLDLKA